ncbi:bifunctional DNA-formamidopyrimidine glycosylase/DNA-(apurinic or apyrimidinic site) lyase [Sulfobacillus thermosulfidooxidans]|uniref:bifunctional DNA-formamidopyrimidine glycosylase/DNA-(apurinic or apyrimidinic site) lyase n=1 Tax=Sulfobacillus thermosulfidooxidans TaxID=28034 RepID=UPI00096BA7BB|nr:bifunctional DNA-formamidopyrimidine glycosylase/DNA-(apurinic or apyrimidinic site) lyase [Sulfobacillus thermosulfidooxidans]OLZ10558.1 DNA-formamidopyrimidine glycosylase [Sulfobacillus thermosulfidooxidans]OLZ22235.1 DNA-formamidopyrimidine glycosylase [Sulfobacillus thermosulfidooxidans]
MPELPEVETIRYYLDHVLPGQKVHKVLHIDPRMVKTGSLSAEEIARRLPGHVVKSIKRRGKFLFLEWETQDHLLIHLGMSGRLIWIQNHEPWALHTHLVLDFEENQLRLIDPRRFGRIGWIDRGVELVPHLGTEPLSADLTSQFLVKRLQGRQAPIKSLLLDQSLIAGLGNIYVDESLFRAKIRPDRPGGSLEPREIKRLVRSIRRVLQEAIEHRGTSFSDYVDALGHPGQNQDYLMVYGRNQAECRVCGQPIVTKVIQGRTSHFCLHCQK